MFNVKKKIVTFVIGFTMVLGLIPTINVQAAAITSSTQTTLSKQTMTAIANLDKAKKTIVIDPGH
ncbi:MAG TPA: N-acetylmuramoyl-L-alanine amidase, partial [Clostridium sp.]